MQEAHEPGLVAGTPKLSLSKERVRFILDELYKGCEGYTLKRRHNFFCKGILAGREKLRWDVPTPSPMIMLPRERSPFTPERFANIRLFNHVFHKFILSLEDPTFYHQQSRYTEQAASALKLSEVSASDINFGRLLFSALANGALLNIHWLNALLPAIARNDIVIEGDLIWVELHHSIPYGQRKADFHRRWFPDPITSLLLVKWLSVYGSVEAEEFYSLSGHKPFTSI